MTFATVILTACMAGKQVTPALWLAPDGGVYIDGRATSPRVVQPARQVKLDGIVAWDFNNGRGGLHFGDPASLRLTGSMTVSLWIKLRSYVNDGPGAQILFRGDDRCGLDPFSMAIWTDGTINFGVQDDQATGRSVGAEIPLNQWRHVLANIDDETRAMEFWLDGALVSTVMTSRRPFAQLDPNWAPGLSIGNVQNETGPHNQPLNGQIADLRVYRSVVRPRDLDVGRGGWTDPPKR